MEGALDAWPSSQVFEDVHGFIADLIAARSLLEVPIGVPDLATADVSAFTLRAGDGATIACSVDHVDVRRDNTGNPAWGKIDRIMIKDWTETTE